MENGCIFKRQRQNVTKDCIYAHNESVMHMRQQQLVHKDLRRNQWHRTCISLGEAGDYE